VTEPKQDPRDPVQVAAYRYIELHSSLPVKRDDLPVKRDDQSVKRDELALAVVVDTIHKIRREQLSQQRLDSYRCPGHVIITL